MNSSRPFIYSDSAEVAMSLLFRTLGSHRVAASGLRSPRETRLRVGPIEDRYQDMCQATLVRLLSITESFAAGIMTRKIDQALARTDNRMADEIATFAAIAATNGWNDQRRYYKDWLRVDVDWKAVERLAEARNSVAHGLGRLTRRQKRTEQSVRAKIEAAGIKIVDDLIILSDESLSVAAVALRDFIERLDLAVQEVELQDK